MASNKTKPKVQPQPAVVSKTKPKAATPPAPPYDPFANEPKGFSLLNFKTQALILAIIGFIFLIILILYSDFFITKQFPDDRIPWAAWNDRSRLLRNFYKLA